MNEESEPTSTLPRDGGEEPIVYAVGRTDTGWHFSRRELLAAAAGATAVAAAGSLTGCSKPKTPPPTATVPLAPTDTPTLPNTPTAPPTVTPVPTATASPVPTRTPAPTRTSTPTATYTAAPTATQTSTATPVPQPGALFVSDVTIPDNTIMEPNKPFTKTWRVKNSGALAWKGGTKLVFVSGSQMGAPKSVPVSETKPVESVDISVDMVTPDKSGSYRSNWRLQAPDGTYFGDELYVVIAVASRTAIPPGEKGVRITTTVGGQTITWTMPCGSAIPPGAVCTCNCVSVPAACSCVGYSSCSCVGHTVTIHYWYPN